MASHVISKNSLSTPSSHAFWLVLFSFGSRILAFDYSHWTLWIAPHLLDPCTQTPFWIIFKIHALTGTLRHSQLSLLTTELILVGYFFAFWKSKQTTNVCSSPPPHIKTLIQSVAGPLLRTQVVKPTSSQGRTVRLKLVRRLEDIRGGDGNSDSSRNSSSWHEVRAVRLEQRAALMVKMAKQLIQTGVTAVPTLNQCSENFNSMFQDVFVSRQRLT